MTRYDALRSELEEQRHTWLVTGAAGFIGGHLAETLLGLGQNVRGLDNFATGKRETVELLRGQHGPASFSFFEGDIADLATCAEACAGVDFVLHQAALGSVPRSIAEPLRTHEANITGFLTMLVAARDAGVRRMVYASSSSVYGDHPDLPKREDAIGAPLSPYATTKRANELYARNFHDAYGFEVAGLRYFNVFGPRQDPAGAYAAVVPKWIAAIRSGATCRINGDGSTSRDFCYVENAVQANLLAATAPAEEVSGRVFNVACGARTTLNELFSMISERVREAAPDIEANAPEHGPERPGDVRHSLADIGRARERIGYEPTMDVAGGLTRTVNWFLEAR